MGAISILAGPHLYPLCQADASGLCSRYQQPREFPLKRKTGREGLEKLTVPSGRLES